MPRYLGNPVYLTRALESVGMRDLFGPREFRDGRVKVYGCSPGCLLASLLVSVVLTLLLNLLIRAF